MAKKKTDDKAFESNLWVVFWQQDGDQMVEGPYSTEAEAREETERIVEDYGINAGTPVYVMRASGVLFVPKISRNWETLV